jgi:hypothetical protein
MLQCELCSEKAESVVIPIGNDITPDSAIFVQEVGYTCSECATDLIYQGYTREMPLEDHNAVFYPEDNSIGTQLGWLQSDDFVYAPNYR